MRIIADKYTDKDRVLLEQTVFDALHFLYRTVVWADFYPYGETPHSIVEKEWLHIFSSGHWQEVLLLKKITDWLKDNDHPYWIPGAGGSSAVLYVLGITEGNPLPPHHRPEGITDILWAIDMIDGFDRAPSFSGPDDSEESFMEIIDDKWSVWARRQPSVCDGHGIPWRILWYGAHVSKWGLTVCCNPGNEQGLREAFADYKMVEDIKWIDMTGEERPKFSVNIIFKDDVPETVHGFFNREITSENWRDVLRLSGLSMEEFMDRCFEFRNSSGNGCGAEYTNDMRELIGYFSDETLFSDMLAFGGLCTRGVWNDTAKKLVRELGYPVHAMISSQDDIYSWLLSLKVPNIGEYFAIDVACGELVPGEHREPYFGFGWSGPTVFLCDDGKKLSPFYDNIVASPAKGIEPWIVKQCRELPYLPPKAQAVERILFELKLLASAQSGQENAR